MRNRNAKVALLWQIVVYGSLFLVCLGTLFGMFLAFFFPHGRKAPHVQTATCWVSAGDRIRTGTGLRPHASKA